MSDQPQQLAGRVRADLAATRTPKGRCSPATMLLLDELTGAVAAEGHPRQPAEYAVTAWLLTHNPIRDCVASEVALGFWKMPRPQQGQQGFGVGWGSRAPGDKRGVPDKHLGLTCHHHLRPRASRPERSPIKPTRLRRQPSLARH